VQLHPTTVPGRWEGNGLAADADGVAWYVGEITLADADTAGDLLLNPGTLDDDDEAWFNGTRIGATAGFGAPRSYAVPRKLLRAGVNRIAIRVTDTGGAGGWVGTKGRAPTLGGLRKTDECIGESHQLLTRCPRGHQCAAHTMCLDGIDEVQLHRRL
jgi:hypothetical protein